MRMAAKQNTAAIATLAIKAIWRFDRLRIFGVSIAARKLLA
jgi:hypothetical protein